MIVHIAYAISALAVLIAVASYWPTWVKICTSKQAPPLATRVLLCVVYFVLSLEMWQRGVFDKNWHIAAFLFGNIVAVALLFFVRGQRKFGTPDLRCAIFCLGAIACKVWSGSTETSLGSNLAIVSGLLAHTFAWLPGLRGALDDPRSESRWTWSMVFASCLLQLLALSVSVSVTPWQWPFAAIVPLAGFLAISGLMMLIVWDMLSQQLRVALRRSTI